MFKGAFLGSRELSGAFPGQQTPARVAWLVSTLIQENPGLAKAEPESFLGALFAALQIGLEPINGRAYLRLKGRRVRMIVGYRGLVDLFYRHERSVVLTWGMVKSTDEFEYELGTDAFLRHKPRPGLSRGISHFWVMAKLAGGGVSFHVMTLEECLDHGRNHSDDWDGEAGEFLPESPWYTERDLMCLKTVLIQLFKVLPIGDVVQRAIGADGRAAAYKTKRRKRSK